eukprot:g7708.t1
MGCTCSCADYLFDKAYGKGPKFATANLETSLKKFWWVGVFHMRIAKEDALAFEKLRQLVYTAKVPASVPWFDMALFCSMAKECSHLVGRYVAIKAAPSHHMKKKAIWNFQSTVLRAHYRFNDGLGGFSTCATACLLGQQDFCASIVDPETKELSRTMFTTENIFVMNKQEVAESFHDCEVRKTRNRWAHIKGSDFRPKPLQTGICDNFKKWLELCRSFKMSLEIGNEVDSHLAAAVALLMEFEGN